MTSIAVLGLGAMGSRMAANLLKAGFNVTVWNRSPAATKPLIAAGAIKADSPREAARNADFVMAMVRDDDVSKQVWLDPVNGAFTGMKCNSVAIESSTLTPSWVRELGATAAERGISFIEAPVSGTTPQAENAQLIYFVGGEYDVFSRATAMLKAMGSTLNYVGPLGSAALTKLTTNTLLGIQVTVIAELIGMLQRSGADTETILNAVATTPVWSTVASRVAHSIQSLNFQPQFPIELIEKDFDYVLSVAGSRDSAPTIAAAHQVFKQAISHGLGQDNMTGVAKLFTVTAG